MNIFRRLFSPGSKEIESPSRAEESNNNPSVKLETGSSSMHQPDPGAGTPQSSQQGKNNCVIEILSSDDERVACTVHDNEGKENTTATSSITNMSDTGISKTTEDAVTILALPTNVSNTKPTAASPLQSTKSPSVTTTDTSNAFDDDGDEGKENAAATASSIDNTSDATTPKAEPDASLFIAKIGDAADLKAKESPLELQSVTITDNSNIYSARKRRKKTTKDSQIILPSTLLSLSSNANANRTNSGDQKKIRKDLPQELSSTPPIRIARNNYLISSSLTASKEGNGENPFDFPSETHKEKLSAIESNNHNPSSNNPNLFETGKRPRHNDATEMIVLPNKRPNTQEDSTFHNSDAKALKDGSSSDQRANTEQAKDAQNPTESKEEVVESPVKAVPEFKLPPELVPFNNPGVCDYGVIRTSRLRNRRKKANVQEDILYQNIQGQRRCRATRDGQKIIGGVNNNRCLNCAEGVFKYCHAHRDLDEEQKFFWEQRKRREESIRSSPSSIKIKTEPKAKSQNTAASKPNLKKISESVMKCYQVDDDLNRCEINPVKRCVVLCQGRGRCNRNILITQPGFCNGHKAFLEEMKATRDETFRSDPGTMHCAAVSKAGSKCKFKAMNQCVFCTKHILLPPETASPVVLMGQIKGVSELSNLASMTEVELTVEKDIKPRGEVGLSNSDMLLLEPQDPPLNVIGTVKNNKSYPHKPVPKNIEFPRKIEISKEQVELATSFDNMCFNVYNSERCWYERAEGSILCRLCRICHDEGKPFDHILNNDVRKDESILFSNKCVRFDKGKPCQNMALEGKILCNECVQSWDETEASSSEYSGASMRSEETDSGDSSSATFSSGSDSEDSHLSDDTTYDAYCKAYTHKEFFNMWKNWEKKTERVDEVEDSRLIKRANNTMCPADTDGQVKAQYGRVLPHAMKKMIKILELRREDIFLDIGHGVGNTCLHASFCTGCDSRGIEVVTDRHEIADKFRGGMYAEHNCGEAPRPEVGKVDLRLGRLEDPEQKDFLTKGVTRAYVNNFNGVFAERSSKNKDKWFLDDYISGIFASMAPGAIMVTFHPLNLGLNRENANSLRSKHNLAESDHASYYESEKILLGQAFCSVKWNKRSGNTNNIFVYKYKRLHQPGHHDAVFLCSNPSCKMASDMVPIPATTKNEDGRCVINHCECKFSPKNLRKRSSKHLSP